jgi:hypothetical protein
MTATIDLSSPRPLTRDQILAIDVGSVMWETYDTVQGVPIGSSRWHFRKVTRVFARGVNVHGEAYICGYHQFGPSSEISFSATQGDVRVQVVS